MAPVVIPYWVWFIIGTVAIILASFLAFHKVRVERDKCIEGLNLTADELAYLRDHRDELKLGVDNYGVLEPIISVLMNKGMIQIGFHRMSQGARQYDQRHLILTERAIQVLQWAEVMNKKEIGNAKT